MLSCLNEYHPPMNSFADRIRYWFTYEKDANQRALEMIDSVPQEQRDHPLFQKAVDKFAHVFAARALWLKRLGGPDAGLDDLFPERTTTEQLHQAYQQLYQAWDSYMQALTDDVIAAEIEYTSTEGDRYRSRVEDVLVQLHGHALYHRGQVATLVTQCGGTAVDTDFVYWTRQAVGENDEVPNDE